MFAVIKTGGKQYKVAAGDELRVEMLSAEPGAHVRFGEVLMIGEGDDVTVGAPTLAGAGVTAEVVDQIRGEKIFSFKKRRRTSSSKRIKGHRQYLTVVRITDIARSGGGGDVAPALGSAQARRIAAAQ